MDVRIALIFMWICSYELILTVISKFSINYFVSLAIALVLAQIVTFIGPCLKLALNKVIQQLSEVKLLNIVSLIELII